MTGNKKTSVKLDDLKELKDMRNTFRRTGELWEVEYEGDSFDNLKNGDQIKYIAYLLSTPGKFIHVTELYRAVHGQEVVPQLDKDDRNRETPYIDVNKTYSSPEWRYGDETFDPEWWDGDNTFGNTKREEDAEWEDDTENFESDPRIKEWGEDYDEFYDTDSDIYDEDRPEDSFSDLMEFRGDPNNLEPDSDNYFYAMDKDPGYRGFDSAPCHLEQLQTEAPTKEFEETLKETADLFFDQLTEAKKTEDPEQIENAENKYNEFRRYALDIYGMEKDENNHGKKFKKKNTAVTERVRSLITGQIKKGIKKIAEHNEKLASHLDDSIWTGANCCYLPSPNDDPWDVELGDFND